MKLNFLKQFTKLQSKTVSVVFVGKELESKIGTLSDKWKVYANEILSGVLFEEVVKKFSKSKGIQQIKAHVTNALKAIGGHKTIETDYSERNSKTLVRHENRDEVVISARDWNIKKGIILSLTSYQFMMEKEIFKWIKGFEILACEMDVSVLRKMFETIKAEKLDYVKYIFAGKIGEIIRLAPEGAFAHANLDFCASIVTFGDDIKIAIERKIVQIGGCIFITVSQRAKGVDTEKELIELIKKAGGKDYDYNLFADGYSDKQGPMYSIIVRRLK